MSELGLLRLSSLKPLIVLVQRYRASHSSSYHNILIYWEVTYLPVTHSSSTL